MRFSHRHALREDDVDLYDEVAAKVEGAHRVDHEDGGMVVQADPGHLGEELRPRRVARQHLDLGCNGKRSASVHLFESFVVTISALQ